MNRYAAEAQPAFQQDQTVPPTTVAVRQQLDTTTRLVAEAHEAHVREARESVRWERRGPLRRLVRLPL
jgi:hypothetical protein